jgi:hypothetical protein
MSWEIGKGHVPAPRAMMRGLTLISWENGRDMFRPPAIYTFRSKNDFEEDSLFRHIEPSHAFHLDLIRLSNFQVNGDVS